MRRALAALLLAAAVPAARAESAGPPMVPDDAPGAFLDLAHPARGEALDLGRHGKALLDAGQVEDARAALEQAVRLHPAHPALWVNLAAARIVACRREEAIEAALVARTLDPDEARAGTNLRLAARLTCTQPPDPAPVARAERAIALQPNDAAAWIDAAAQRRAAGDRLVAALYEDIARGAGAPAAAGWERIGDDLAAAGLLRAAAGAWERAGAGERARETRAALAALAPRVKALAAPVARRARLDDADGLAQVEQLAEIVLGAGLDDARALARLEGLFGLAAARAIAGPWGRTTLRTDFEALAVAPGPGAPLALWRRFPGDTQVALFAWPAPDTTGERAAALAALVDFAPALRREFAPCDPPVEGYACREAMVELDLGPEGRAPARLVRVGPRLAALVLAGGGGLGPAAREDAASAAAAQVAALEPAAEPPAADGLAWALPVPVAWTAERAHREDDEPWRGAPLGDGLVLDLPPGTSAGRVGTTFRDAACGADTRLSFAGRFVDRDGVAVTLGTPGLRAQVDVLPGRGADLAAARAEPARALAPPLDPGARFVAAASLDAARDRAGTGGEGTIARFEGNALRGTWLVAWCRIGEDLVRIALPAAEGARSLALPWIALTVRREGAKGPPPPVDLSARQAIRFARLAGHREGDPREGLLAGDEVELPVPRGFRLSLSGLSRDGFPATLRDEGGTTLVLERIAVGDDPQAARRRARVLAGAADDLAWGAPEPVRGGTLVTAPAGPREMLVFVLLPAPGGKRSAYALIATRGAGTAADSWTTALDLARHGLRYR